MKKSRFTDEQIALASKQVGTGVPSGLEVGSIAWKDGQWLAALADV